MSGFSKIGLDRIASVLQDHVAKGSAPGLVGLINRGAETHAFPAGRLALEGSAPVERNSLFRIASMTKPVTAAAVMMLIEEGKLRLDDAVERFLPELKGRRVLRRLDGPIEDTVPAKRPITVEDLLTFRLGWGIVFSDKPLPILEAIGDLPGFGMPNPLWPGGPDEYMRRLGALPLMHQPGEAWLYTAGSNIQGVLVARVSGQSLDSFFQSRIFEPLGMNETAFFVPKSRLSRLASVYWPKDGALTLFDPPEGRFAAPPSLPAGDSGLVSTADDYLAFAEFLRSGLAKNGKRLLSEGSLEAMRTDYLTAEQRESGRLILGPDRGWGYGMGVSTNSRAYGWDGGYGTSWISDPSHRLTAILLTQRHFDSPERPAVHTDFHRAVQAALSAPFGTGL